jgi:DNA-binding CsgD family transcriptional regulator
MSLPTLCPACLETLPAGYEFDHVAVDLALDDRPELFAGMSHDERAEVVRTGLARGLNATQMSRRFHTSVAQIHALLPEQDRPSLDDKQELLAQIRQLWEQDLTDSEIGLRLSKAPGTVNKLRARMKLPAKFGPGGFRKKVVSA